MDTSEKGDWETEDVTALLILCDEMENYTASLSQSFSLVFSTAKQEFIKERSLVGRKKNGKLYLWA